MSKMFEREFRAGPAVQPPAEPASLIDEESARHIALLVQTDTKLDLVNRRLDQFVTELSRWGHTLEEAADRRESAAAPRTPWGGLVVACAVFALGAAAGVGLAPWWDAGIPPFGWTDGSAGLQSETIQSPEATQLAVGPEPLPQAAAPAQTVMPAEPLEPPVPPAAVLPPPPAVAPPVMPAAEPPESPEPPAASPEAPPEDPGGVADPIPAPAAQPERVLPAVFQPIDGRIRL
jgi:hypothetical protein